MTAQGTLNLDCIASDPSSSYLYGIASAYKDMTSKDYSDSFVVLVKSNYSPTNLANITWTVVSSVNGKEFSYNYPTFNSVDCAANDKGHFTAFFRNPYRTTSPVTSFPMGIRYEPRFEEWTTIQGSALFGWTSDRFAHMSFYSKYNGDVNHLLTSHYADQIAIGIMDYSNRFEMRALYNWRYDAFMYLRTDSMAEFRIEDDFDYTRRGLFSLPRLEAPNLIAYHRNTLYRNAMIWTGRYKPFCQTFSDIDQSLSPGDCPFGGPAPASTGNALRQTHYYMFSGERKNSTYFGGIFNDGNVFKIYTTEKLENRVYLDHIINRTDSTSDFAVHQNFQTVGGLNEGQEPFVVALTSAGLFEFAAFGPNAGSMAGPFKISISDSFNSLPQRVVRAMKGKLLTTDERRELDARIKKGKLGGSVAAVAVLVLVLVGFLVWRRWSHMKQGREKGVDPLDPPVCLEKHEVDSLESDREQGPLSDLSRVRGRERENPNRPDREEMQGHRPIPFNTLPLV